MECQALGTILPSSVTPEVPYNPVYLSQTSSGDKPCLTREGPTAFSQLPQVSLRAQAQRDREATHGLPGEWQEAGHR